MTTHFITPVGQASTFHLTDFANLFSHLPKKKFSVFLMSDFVKETDKIKTDGESREEFEQRIKKEARKLNTEVHFISNQASFDSLLSWSCFADLVSVQAVTVNSLDQFDGVFSDGMLRTMNCSLFISSNFTADAFEEVMIVGDFDQSIVTAVKSFLTLFGSASRNKKVTLFTPEPDDDLSITFERDLVSFIVKSFPDTGIVPIKIEELEKQLIKTARTMERPLLMIGNRNRKLLLVPELRKEIIDRKISVFYSN